MTDPSLQSSNSTVPHISSDLSMCDIKATLLLCTLIMNHTLFFNSTCGFSSVMPVLMRALESKCQIVAVCCCKCNLSSLLIHYERIYSLSEKHVNFSTTIWNSRILPLFTYIYSKGQMKSFFTYYYVQYTFLRVCCIPTGCVQEPGALFINLLFRWTSQASRA